MLELNVARTMMLGYYLCLWISTHDSEDASGRTNDHHEDVRLGVGLGQG